ncbi:MAG: hypothetical protein ACRDZO_05445 [Egibacteraceae bacterium]
MSTHPPPRSEDLRRWLAGQEAAQARQRQELRERPPSETVTKAMALIDLAAALHGWPLPEDVVRRRECRRARETWARLHRGMARDGRG